MVQEKFIVPFLAISHYTMQKTIKRENATEMKPGFGKLIWRVPEMEAPPNGWFLRGKSHL